MIEKETIHIDIETRSSVDLKTHGVDRYVSSPDFTILLCAFQDGNMAEPYCIDYTAGTSDWDYIFEEMLVNDDYIKVAHNATFEMRCFEQFFGVKLDPNQWRDTMAMSYYVGLPGSLEKIGPILDLSEHKTKTSDINFFCKPYRGNFRKPQDHKERWEEFKAYNIQDVVSEKAVYEKLKDYPINWNDWVIDYHINKRGIAVDIGLVENCISLHEKKVEQLKEEAKQITGLDNPNSLEQIKNWLAGEHMLAVKDLKKRTVEKMLKDINLDPEIARVLEIRQQLGKSSMAKYQKIIDTEKEGRVYGMLQIYGSHTHRWAGRNIQFHNLPRNSCQDLANCRELVKLGIDPRDNIREIPQNILSQLIRTAFVSPEGELLSIADFSAIEARVLSWIAGEDWRNKVFATHGKIYEASAAKMFNVPIEEVTKESEYRQKGKIAELALGYGGSVGALTAMNAEGSESELREIVNLWRESNKYIVHFWKEIENACKEVILDNTTVYTGYHLTIHCDGEWLYITLPSGEVLYYRHPKVIKKWVETGENSGFNATTIIHYGVESVSRKWMELDTYGGKLAENITQAIARDILNESIRKLAADNARIVMHVHDEIIVESFSLDTLIEIMEEEIDWAPGLVLKAEGFYSEYFKKE